MMYTNENLMVDEEITVENRQEAIMAQIDELENVLQGFAGLVLEVCGTWLWASGETKEHKEVLKSLGFHYASKKKMWYWRDASDTTKRSRGATMDYIRSKYGSIRTVTDDEEVATAMG